MAEQEKYPNPNESLISDISVKLRDIEEKQNIIKDRVLLIGENLISEKEEVEKTVDEIKSDIARLEDETKKIRMAVERVIDDLNNFVRRNEFSILQRQFKMFEPLELARISDVEEMIDKALKNKK
jgi:archaellum component FlaC